MYFLEHVLQIPMMLGFKNLEMKDQFNRGTACRGQSLLVGRTTPGEPSILG
jgi:hypothetical protein